MIKLVDIIRDNASRESATNLTKILLYIMWVIIES
jgi:hypothetical protein